MKSDKMEAELRNLKPEDGVEKIISTLNHWQRILEIAERALKYVELSWGCFDRVRYALMPVTRWAIEDGWFRAFIDEWKDENPNIAAELLPDLIDYLELNKDCK